MRFPLLTIIIFLPILGGFLALASSRRPLLCRWISLIISLIELGLVMLPFFLDLKPQTDVVGTWLLTEDVPWIKSLGIRYTLGMDGLSQALIALTGFLQVPCVLVSWKQINSRVGAFHFFLLFTQSAIMGVFLAEDLFLFYLFWEAQLIPVFFLIGIWGHSERIHATLKFFLFSIAGSLLMLIAIIGLYLIHGSQTGVYTFSLSELMSVSLSDNIEFLLYAAFLLSFAIKVPVIPVHTWLPDAHTQAPTAGSVDLAGLLLKTGPYALFRIAIPLFPTAAKLSMPFMVTLGLAGLFYASWVALSQSDIKRLVAYSSIAHMGLVIIGLGIWDAMTLNGAFLQMINHGVSTSALFIMIGMLGERVDSRAFADIGGLWKKMPVFSAFFLFFAMAAAGLPGLNNFVGEILILVGSLRSNALVGVLAFAGMVFTLAYVLRMVRRALFGHTINEHLLWDLTSREIVVLVVPALAILLLGLHPDPVLSLFKGAVNHALAHTPF